MCFLISPASLSYNSLRSYNEDALKRVETETDWASVGGKDAAHSGLFHTLNFLREMNSSDLPSGDVEEWWR